MACERCSGTDFAASCSRGMCLADELAALEAMPDSEIDTSDIPETLDWSGAERGKFHMKRDG